MFPIILSGLLPGISLEYSINYCIILWPTTAQLLLLPLDVLQVLPYAYRYYVCQCTSLDNFVLQVPRKWEVLYKNRLRFTESMYQVRQDFREPLRIYLPGGSIHHLLQQQLSVGRCPVRWLHVCIDSQKVCTARLSGAVTYISSRW